MGVEAILKEHMPRDSEIETAGAFFRKTSVAEGKMDLAELEELGVDTSEMVENLAPTTNGGGDVASGDTPDSSERLRYSEKSKRTEISTAFTTGQRRE